MEIFDFFNYYYSALLGCPLKKQLHSSHAKLLLGHAEDFKETLSLAAPDSGLYLDSDEGFLLAHGRSSTEVLAVLSYLPMTWFNNKVWITYSASDKPHVLWQRTKNIIETVYPFTKDSDSLSFLDRLEAVPLDYLWSQLPKVFLELWDGHCGLRPKTPMGELPYDCFIEESRLVVANLSTASKAWRLGVRPGWEIIASQEPTAKVVLGARNSRPYLEARELLKGKAGVDCNLIARENNGTEVSWIEPYLENRWLPSIQYKTISDNHLYIKISAFISPKQSWEEFQNIFQSHRQSNIIIDLRFNPGGNIGLATKFKQQIIKDSSLPYYRRIKLPNGGLSEFIRHVDLGKSNTQSKRHYFILTNGATGSACENFLMGLKGLPYITLVGQVTAGCLGHPLIYPMNHEFNLWVSTTLYYDYKKNLIEGTGIEPDHLLSQVQTDSDYILNYVLDTLTHE